MSTALGAASAAARSASRASKPSKVVILRVPPEKLSSLTQIPPKSKSRSRPSNAAAYTPSKEGKATRATPTSMDSPSDANQTPVPADATEVSKKRKSLGDADTNGTGNKDEPSKEDNSTPKPRGKPGPKKRKVETENGQIKPATTSGQTASHKLGPKANQGAINAGLRALDRTGKPSRRWHRRGFMLKSFTGVSWALPCWETPKLSRIDSNGDVKSETPSSSDVNKAEPNSSMVGSEKSASGNDTSGQMAPPPQPNGRFRTSKTDSASQAIANATA